MITYTLKIVDIKTETADAVTLCFKQPGLKKIKYEAGQYLTLIFRINGRRYIRPYSFSSCPGVDDFLEVTVKRVLNGVVSNHINDTVKIGDNIEAMSPMGNFTYNRENSFNKVYLWGMGSGITPLISIAKYILYSDEQDEVHLIYGNRTHEETIFLEKIANLSKTFNGRFNVTHFHTQLVVDENNLSVVQGRIETDEAIKILNQGRDVEASVHYICGSKGLKESVKKALAHFQVDSNNVFSEDFELVKNPQDFEGVDTQNVKLGFMGNVFDLEVVRGKSILEAALDSNIELPYSCQTGNCSTCKAKVISGESKMIGLSGERYDLLDNEYLLCCTYPLSDNVFVEI